MEKVSEKGSLLEESAINAAEEEKTEDQLESVATLDSDLERFHGFEL